jgi:hypothetical protein
VIETPHTVRHLRFRGRLANPRLARGRVEAALDESVGASRLGKETILCVRRFAISLPRIDRLPEALEAEVLGAARPARGFVPANANAVLFADRAELLACLARDWCIGNTSVCWWWSVLFPREDFAAIVRRAWLQDARPVPAALNRLESVGLAARFLAKFSQGEIAALWRNIVNTFHLQALDLAWSAIDITAIKPAVVRQPRDTAPWSPWVEADSSLIPEGARVLITAILLKRAPAVVRAASFVRGVHAWRKATETAFAKDETFRHTEEGSRFAEFSPRQPDLRVGPNENLPNTQEGSPGKRSKTGHPARSDSDTTPQSAQAARNSRRRSTASSQEYRASSDIHENGAREDSKEKSATIVSPDVARAGLDVVPLPPAAAPDQIYTEWGGSFYLVNVAIALGLYGDFTTPAKPGLALSLWDFLALVGERMIGEEFASDALPELLAKLSGRVEGELPAAHFEPPTGEPLGTWLDGICNDLQERLTTSLGEIDHGDLRALVLNHRARIEADSLRVDAYFSLVRHPIELRIAGLDRDPGWVPAAGRSIYFHYD